MYDDQPARQPSPPMPAEPHESGPPTPRRCRAEDVPCDCSGFCYWAAARFPIEAARS